MPVVPPTTTAVFPCKSKMEALMKGLFLSEEIGCCSFDRRYL